MPMRTIRSFGTLFGGGAVVLSTLLPAQGGQPVPIRVVGSSRTISMELVGGKPVATPVAVAANPSAPQDPGVAEAANKRLQAFKQAIFDRRPSSVLKAWSTPELKPYDPAEENEKLRAPAGDELSKEQIEKLLEQQFGQPPVQPGSPAEQQLQQKILQREIEMLQRDVVLGRWDAVGAFFAALPEKEQKGAYEHFLTVLPRHPVGPQEQRVPPNLQEKNRFTFADVLALAGIAPGGFDKKQVKQLAPVVRRALDDGFVVEELVQQLLAETSRPPDGASGSSPRLDRREAALLLGELQFEQEMGAFLPAADEAIRDNDREGLNLLARHALALWQKEQRGKFLETAWQVTQAALDKGEIGEEDKAEALRRAVELAPKVRAELGPQWLGESFTQRPERGMEIVATIGGQVARGFQERGQDTKYRADGLKLQKTAVEALLDKAPELATQWSESLGLLAAGWIQEAHYSNQFSQSNTLGPVMERDEFGNIFWTQRRMGGGGQVQALEPADLLESQPGERWAALLGPALRPHFWAISAQLCLKVSEPERAFPFIEKLAADNPRKAKELAHEFLRVWMRNNNPNTNNRTNSYMFIYGFDQRASGIPLTRSKQERNLDDLSRWVTRLRALPIGGVDEKLLGEAFVAAHSKAEVYRLETIERVFGDVGSLDPVLLGELLGTMRTNLATIWRRPSVQEAQKTRRTQRQMLEEVARGYQTALTLAQDALNAHGRHWALLAVVASLLHDQNNFGKELQRDSGFAEARKAAFELFAAGAAHYAEVVGSLRIDQETLRPFDIWFYAALGASDLGAIDEETVLARSQLPLIKQAIDALPEGSRDRHLAMFANQLFTRMSAVRPQIKFRYLDAGFEIVGDHPQAREAKKVWDYYQDLLRELKLEAVVEGDARIGTEPFGVRVDIVHSPEIERESGGFQKYATNQNNQAFAYNYGRPLENYRDRFQEVVSASLQEHFEVLSVTFNSEAMVSQPTDAPGWRRTPYAWILLKARGPQVDRVPTIQLDFDFLDTTGFTVLPIGSAPVVVDAAVSGPERPFSKLEVNQLLDERRADEGKITLEIKAKAKGLVPTLETFLDLDAPGFVVAKRDDQGASVVRFSEDQDGIESERVWLLQLTPANPGERPKSFVFGKPKLDGITAVYQRYDDADLQTVSAEVALSGLRPAADPVWAWVLIGIAACAAFVWLFFARPKPSTAQPRELLQMPAHVTPFTVLALLQRVEATANLSAEARAALAADVQRIEACHFGRAADDGLDLAAVAEQWLRRAI
jgi:hypothetical protein